MDREGKGLLREIVEVADIRTQGGVLFPGRVRIALDSLDLRLEAVDDGLVDDGRSHDDTEGK
ncbi:MAG: hypothetical protein HYU28_02220 [Actinobacteria bacterium]|nr:hypothetical protein [Actinomycetota bacterium]